MADSIIPGENASYSANIPSMSLTMGFNGSPVIEGVKEVGKAVRLAQREIGLLSNGMVTLGTGAGGAALALGAFTTAVSAAVAFAPEVQVALAQMEIAWMNLGFATGKYVAPVMNAVTGGLQTAADAVNTVSGNMSSQDFTSKHPSSSPLSSFMTLSGNIPGMIGVNLLDQFLQSQNIGNPIDQFMSWAGQLFGGGSQGGSSTNATNLTINAQNVNVSSNGLYGGK